MRITEYMTWTTGEYEVRWYGGAWFNVYRYDAEVEDFVEVSAFTYYDVGAVTAPALEQARRIVAVHLAAVDAGEV